MRRAAKVAVGALIFGWAAVAVVSLVGCGHVKPPPPAPPPGSVSCDVACGTAIARTCIGVDLCATLCARVTRNQPEWPGCVSVATTCPQVKACR